MAKFWDYESRFVNRYFSYNNGDELLRQMKPYLLDRGTLLDYGCGGGVLLGKMLDQGYRVGGLDFSEQSVQTIAQRFGPRENFLGAFLPHQLIAEVRHSDAVFDAVSNAVFDAILVIEVLEHLDNESLSQTLEIIKHGLAPDGIVIFSTPNEEDLEALQVLCPCCEHVFHRWQHVTSWSEKSLGAYLDAYGFQIVDAFTTNFKRKKWQRWKNMTASWKHWLSPSRAYKKPPHLAVVCQLSAAEIHPN